MRALKYITTDPVDGFLWYKTEYFKAMNEQISGTDNILMKTFV